MGFTGQRTKYRRMFRWWGSMTFILSQFVLPPLTTVQMSCRHLAAAAIQALRAGIEPDHPKAAQKEWHIPTHLVVRQSSAFPRGTLPARVQDAAKTK